ncbi:hypothetical protein D3C79_784870 [compost metagenome]
MWVEQAQYQLFAKGGGQRRQAQFHFAATWQAALHTAILRPAFFRDIHAAQVLQAADDGQGHAGREGVDRMQEAVYAIAQPALLAAWLKMDVTGALFDSVLQQPVDDMHDMRVVCRGVALALVLLQQLLELTQAC